MMSMLKKGFWFVEGKVERGGGVDGIGSDKGGSNGEGGRCRMSNDRDKCRVGMINVVYVVDICCWWIVWVCDWS